ncbi:serine/threonine-protein kinase haspin [Pimephales promelas]|nr:serine/threonine-protein kinase haspin [Pimephales promelas]
MEGITSCLLSFSLALLSLCVCDHFGSVGGFVRSRYPMYYEAGFPMQDVKPRSSYSYYGADLSNPTSPQRSRSNTYSAAQVKGVYSSVNSNSVLESMDQSSGLQSAQASSQSVDQSGIQAGSQSVELSGSLLSAQTSSQSVDQSGIQASSQSVELSGSLLSAQASSQSGLQEPAQASSQSVDESGIQEPTQSSSEFVDQSVTQQPAQASSQSVDQSGIQQPAQASSQSVDQSGIQQPAQASSQSVDQSGIQQPAQSISQSLDQSGFQQPAQASSQSVDQSGIQQPAQSSSQSGLLSSQQQASNQVVPQLSFQKSTQTGSQSVNGPSSLQTVQAHYQSVSRPSGLQTAQAHYQSVSRPIGLQTAQARYLSLSRPSGLQPVTARYQSLSQPSGLQSGQARYQSVSQPSSLQSAQTYYQSSGLQSGIQQPAQGRYQSLSQPSGLQTAQAGYHSLSQPSSLQSGQVSYQSVSQPSGLQLGQANYQSVSQPSSLQSAQAGYQSLSQPSGLQSGQVSYQSVSQPSGLQSAQARYQSVSQPSGPQSAQGGYQSVSQLSGLQSAQASYQSVSHPSGLQSGQARYQSVSQLSGLQSAQARYQAVSQPSSLQSGQARYQSVSQPSDLQSAQPDTRLGVPAQRPASQPKPLPRLCPSQQSAISANPATSLCPSCSGLQSPAQARYQSQFYKKQHDSDNHAANKTRKRAQNRAALAEVSFNDSDDQQLPSKRPLLASTPSVVCRKLRNLPEPSISEISSLSFDELHQEAGCGEADQRKGGSEVEATSAQATRAFGCVLTPPHLESLVEDLKERCRTVDVDLALKRIDVTDHLSSQSCSRKQEEKITSNPPCLESSKANKQNSQNYVTASSNCSSLSKPSLYISSKSFNTSSSTEAIGSNMSLIERLKAECLLSSLTVCIPRLDLVAYPFVHQGATKAPCTDSPPYMLPISRRETVTSLSFKGTGNDIPNSPIHHRSPSNAEVVVRRLSASFQPPPASPPAAACHSKRRPPAVPKERTGAGTGTGRKVCVSGLNVSRWSKRGTGEFNEKRKKKEGRTKAVSGDYSSGCSMLSAGADTFSAETTCGWLQGTSGIVLAVTPLRVSQMNLSSILANFTPDTLTTHSWGRLKAALSLHKKKTAIPTPRRLGQYHLKSPGCGFTADTTSVDMFASPLFTPSRVTPSRMLRSTMNTPMTSYDDISDADKVYQECQQNGPISFSDCIPPARMKHCNKIGEGTFGEVFSTINDSNETVALKIIPVEGSQQVNGEHQKTFCEILHEIIISKELSSLNIKEINKTDGFIGLNNLHCVRGCYPEALLKAWDEFDCQKGSENDRPDFFDDEQLFLILEFEFGGSDLENINGKVLAHRFLYLYRFVCSRYSIKPEVH